MKKQNVNTKSNYTTDNFAKIKGEDGKVEVKRWVQERQATVTLVTHEGAVFHNGARIA